MYLFGLSFSTADENIKGDYIMDLEFLVIDFLLKCLFIYDDFVSID